MLHMPRISVSLPDSLHDDIKRIADSSNVSVSSTVRAILSDVVPRMVSVLDYLGTSPAISSTDVDDAGVWIQELRALYDRAPATFRDAVPDLPHDAPPTLGGHD